MKKYILSLMTDKRNDLLAQILKALLWVLSLVYGAMVAITRALYVYRILPVFISPKPVISVGNITVGGSGKTPLIIWLAKQLKQEGIKPVILTRGYMSQTGEDSDEAKMIAEVLPDIPLKVGSSRVVNIRDAVQSLPVDVFLCDDAFQHWPLKRDLDIVAIDAANPWGNGHLLPRGILRERLSALRRASIFVLTKTDRAENIEDLRRQLAGLNSKTLIVETRHQVAGLMKVGDKSTVSLNAIKNEAVIGLCAIGDPSSFEATLFGLGARVEKMFTFIDHHVYTAEDIIQLVDRARRNNVKYCVTTHKDAVKIQPFKDLFGPMQFVYVAIELKILQGEDEFRKQIMACARR